MVKQYGATVMDHLTNARKGFEVKEMDCKAMEE